VVATESGLEPERCRALINLATRIRGMKGVDLEEVVSTRLLIYAATLVAAGLDSAAAVEHAIIEPLSDDADVKAGLRELAAACFG
jgi:nitric oxide reductase NorQ protein